MSSALVAPPTPSQRTTAQDRPAPLNRPRVHFQTPHRPPAQPGSSRPSLFHDRHDFTTVLGLNVHHILHDGVVVPPGLEEALTGMQARASPPAAALGRRGRCEICDEEEQRGENRREARRRW